MAKVKNGTVKIIVQPKYSNLYPFYSDEAKFLILHKDKDGQYGLNMTEGYINIEGHEIFSWKMMNMERCMSIYRKG